MNSSIRFAPRIEEINELAAKLDPLGRSFIFMEWNPLYNETDTAESKFWREWINLHILFRECRPGNIPQYLNAKFPSFFDYLGYNDDDLRRLFDFVNLLREGRLYRCHPNFDITDHTSRKNKIKSSFDSYDALNPLIFQDWQVRAKEEDWETALEWLYNEAAHHLVNLKTALEAVTSEARQKALNSWISMYACWFKSRNAQDLFVNTAIRNFFKEQAETQGNLSEKVAEKIANQNFKLFKDNDTCMKELLNQYQSMDSYSSFDPEELTYQILVKMMPSIASNEPRITMF